MGMSVCDVRGADAGVMPPNAKASDVAHILNTAAKSGMSCSDAGDKLVLRPDADETWEAIEAALEAARNAPEEPTLVDAVHHRDLDLFLLTISDGRRLALPREDPQAVAHATPEQAADFQIEPNRVDIWWPQVDEGIYLPNTLEGRYGNEAWIDHLHRRSPVAA